MHATAASKHLDALKQHSVDPDELLAIAGFDENGRCLIQTNDDEFEGDATRHLDYFERRTDPVTPEQLAACHHTYMEAREAEEIANAVELKDIRQAAQCDEDRAKVFRAIGADERAEEAERDAHELRQLAAVTARRLLRIHELFSEAFEHAVSAGNWNVAQAHLIDAVKSPEADYALKVACVRALAEIASFVPGDKGAPFDGEWLAALTGTPLRTAQDYIASARGLESGIAAILTGTEFGSRNAVRKLVEMTPARRHEAITAVKQYLTRYLIQNQIKKERKQRSPKLSLTEIRALSTAGLNNEEGWAHLLSLNADDANVWLAGEVDRALKQRVLSEATAERGRQAHTELKSRIRRNAR